MNKTLIPNIFNYATSELSQDAFIAWLLEWANTKYKNEDQELHFLGKTFLQSLLSKESKSNLKLDSNYIIDIKTQYHKIDVFVNLKIGNKHIAIIIEDKVHTKNHSGQLEKYKQRIEGEKKYDIVIAIYFKTGFQHCFKEVIENKYCPYIIKDFVAVLEQGKEIRNDVLGSYYQYILEKEKEYDFAETSYKEYKKLPIEKWNWWSYTGFFEDTKKRFNAGWGSVGNNRQPLLALWCEGSPINITDADTGKKLVLEMYLDVIHSTNHLSVNFRIGKLNKHPQINNRNRNNIYDQFTAVLAENNIKHRKPRFRKSKGTLCLAQVLEIDKTLKHEGLITMLEQYKEISHQFAKDYKDA